MRRVVGIIGGMGPEAGVEFQRRLFAARRGQPDQEHLPVLFVSDPAIPDRTESLRRGDERWVARIIRLGRQLESLGATEIVMCCNTAHARWKQIQLGLTVPLVNLLALTVEDAVRSGAQRVGLLATRGALAEKIFHDAFACTTIKIIEPDEMCQRVVDDLIYGPRGLKRRGPLPEHASRMTSLLASFPSIDRVILGCTELSLLGLDGAFFLDPLESAVNWLSLEKEKARSWVAQSEQDSAKNDIN